MDNSWNPWKMTAIGMALVAVTALVTAVVVANWTGRPADSPASASVAPPSASPPPPAPALANAPAAAPAPPSPPPPPPPAAAPSTKALSREAAVQACNRYAANHSAPRDKTLEVVKDGAIGAALGAAVGAAGGAIADGGHGAGRGAAIGGLVGAGGGALYGLNENKKHDERYRHAYAGCMRSHGYGG